MGNGWTLPWFYRHIYINSMLGENCSVTDILCRTQHQQEVLLYKSYHEAISVIRHQRTGIWIGRWKSNTSWVRAHTYTHRREREKWRERGGKRERDGETEMDGWMDGESAVDCYSCDPECLARELYDGAHFHPCHWEGCFQGQLSADKRCTGHSSVCEEPWTQAEHLRNRTLTEMTHADLHQETKRQKWLTETSILKIYTILDSWTTWQLGTSLLCKIMKILFYLRLVAIWKQCLWCCNEKIN